MITSIDKLESLGIFSDIPPQKARPFKHYNLIYGWNGSGKSTLSRLFDFMGGRKLPKEYEELKTKVTVNGRQYSESQFPIAGENIAVFNEDFVKDNIDWDGTLKSILLFDEKIGDVKRYKELKEEIYGAKKNEGLIYAIAEKDKLLIKVDNDMQKILTSIGKYVKNNYQLLDTTDTYYLNYDKRKVSNLINNESDMLSDDDILEPKDLEKLIKEARPIKKDLIEIDVALMDIDYLINMTKDTKEILQRKVVSKVIDELRQNPLIASWVEKGLEIHKNDGKFICAFCGNTISEKRINDLESHFSNALKFLKDDINNIIDKWISLKQVKQDLLINASIFYDEIISDVKVYNNEFEILYKNMNDEIDKYIKLLKEKNDRPFDYIEPKLVYEKITDYAKSINIVLSKYKNSIASHNKKTKTFDESTKAVKKRIERHYVQEQINALNYNGLAKEYKKIEIDINSKQIEVNEKLDDFNWLENELSNETLGAKKFNEELEKFLGYGEISLEFDKKLKGYKIYRNSHMEAKNLSEGEKTAIAFIYFIIKLKENNRKIEDYILVIDDPVSSFDSNKIFSSYAYMKSECENAKQIFLLTHNYNYFSLMLGWFCKKRTKEKASGKEIPEYSLYRIENKIENGRRIALLCDGGESMKQATEYDYIFYTVYSMKDTVLTKQESIFYGNICRKLIESFLSFKFPKQRADLMALLNAALPGKENDIKRESIYKFVNIYSHKKKINVFEELDAEIFDANNHKIVEDILDMIRNLDEGHFNSMVDKVKNEM